MCRLVAESTLSVVVMVLVVITVLVTITALVVITVLVVVGRSKYRVEMTSVVDSQQRNDTPPTPSKGDLTSAFVCMSLGLSGVAADARSVSGRDRCTQR
jgi:hypothetical protein